MAVDTVLDKKTITSVEPPKMYSVIIMNDDVTPMDFVISLLVSNFKHSPSQAVQLTLDIHNNGSAVAGVYAFEIAEQKMIDSINIARTNGWPLQIKISPE
jgi:ATP-dependent Clp protease adaptor protein ClpS